MARWKLETLDRPGITSVTGIHVVYQPGQDPKQVLKDTLEESGQVQNPDQQDGLEIVMPCGETHRWNTLRAVPLTGRPCRCGSSQHRVVVFEEIRARAGGTPWGRVLQEQRRPGRQVGGWTIHDETGPAAVQVPIQRPLTTPTDLHYQRGERYPVHFDRIEMPRFTRELVPEVRTGASPLVQREVIEALEQFRGRQYSQELRAEVGRAIRNALNTRIVDRETLAWAHRTEMEFIEASRADHRTNQVRTRVLTALQAYQYLNHDADTRRETWQDIYAILREEQADQINHVWAVREAEGVLGREPIPWAAPTHPPAQQDLYRHQIAQTWIHETFPGVTVGNLDAVGRVTITTPPMPPVVQLDPAVTQALEGTMTQEQVDRAIDEVLTGGAENLRTHTNQTAQGVRELQNQLADATGVPRDLLNGAITTRQPITFNDALNNGRNITVTGTANTTRWMGVDFAGQPVYAPVLRTTQVEEPE